MSFSALELIEPLLRAVAAEGYQTPTPIQQQAIPPILAGRDLLGCAQTGTGKTAAFALPVLQRLATAQALASAPRDARPAEAHDGRPSPSHDSPPSHARNSHLSHARDGHRDPRQSSSRDPRRSLPRQPPPQPRPVRALVLTPTRELAAQIGDSFTAYGRHLRLRNTVIFGGVGQSAQEDALARGPEIVVATPGRLLDLASQGKVTFEQLEIFVLDEADRMLDMGFIHDVRKVIAMLPARRQTLFFSATMPRDILDLSARILVDPARVAVTPIASTAEKVEQKVFFVEKSRKRALLESVLGDPSIERALVFTRTKHGANRVAEQLARASIGAEVIHGNKSQNARERALLHFRRGTTRVLVATDIAARGIDVDGVSHVINFDLPDVPESYVHRIGRTARAGASGIALSFCDSEEVAMLSAIERLIRARIPVDDAHPPSSLPPPPPGAPAPSASRGSSGRGPGGSSSRGPGGSSGRSSGGRSPASASGPGAGQAQRRSFSARPRRRYAAP